MNSPWGCVFPALDFIVFVKSFCSKQIKPLGLSKPTTPLFGS